MFRRIIANIRLDAKLRQQRIVREAEAQRSREAYWAAQRRRWANDPLRRQA